MAAKQCWHRIHGARTPLQGDRGCMRVALVAVRYTDKFKSSPLSQQWTTSGTWHVNTAVLQPPENCPPPAPVTHVSRQHEQMKSRTLAIANISIAQGSTDVRETTSAYARGQPGWAGGQQMMSTKIMNLSQVVNQGLCETALSAEHERPVFTVYFPGRKFTPQQTSPRQGQHSQLGPVAKK